MVSGNKRKGNMLYGSSLSLDETVQKLDIKGDDMKNKSQRYRTSTKGGNQLDGEISPTK